MGPHAEQLVRDYLSRLATAARGQLGRDDRRALVNRTRDFIERKTALAGSPTAFEVARLLSGLGDPAGLVSRERQRLARLRGEELPPASRRRLARMLRGDPDRVRGASWHWPVQEGSRADLQLTLLDASSPTADWGSSNGAGGGGRKSAGPATRDADGTAALVPARAADVAETADVGEISGPRPEETVLVASQQAAPGYPRLVRVSAALATFASWSRRNKVEATAVVLLGIGGAIFPPVWLMGAAVALTSRLWDHRDKWLSLALPVLLTVIGLPVGIAAAGSRGTLGQHLHEGWVFADVISRLVALLSASYLAWRAARGRRPPVNPPWSKPRKIP